MTQADDDIQRDSRSGACRCSARLADHEWTLIWSSLRYFMGRRSIASATYPSLIVEHYYDRLSDAQKEGLARDLREHLNRYGKFGDVLIDDPVWCKFLAALEVEKHYQVLLSNENLATVFEANGRVYPLAEYLARPYQEIYLDKEHIKERV